MKFHEIPIGERFEWQGGTYRKDSALTASSETSGERKVIRRSAQVTLQRAVHAGVSVASIRRTRDWGEVLQAFEAYCCGCLRALEEEDILPQVKVRLRARFSAAATQFKRTIAGHTE